MARENPLAFPTGFGYAPAPESTDHVQLREHYDLFIGGEFTPASAGASFATINPATLEPLATVAQADEEDVGAAVAAARAALKNHWAPLSGAERGKYLFRLARMLAERAREFAVIESLDGGKPIRESRDIDVPLASAHLFYYAGWADKLGYACAGKSPQPRGVCAQIIPWNFPLLMLAWKVAPALAAGNTVVLKPAETTPLTAMKFAELCIDAGLPPGVVNILPGDGATGAALVAADEIDKLAFTGSTAVGRDIMRALAGRGVPYTLELGGKAANVVFADAAIDQAVEGIVNGIFFNQGHVCCAGSRLLVAEAIAEPLLEALRERMQTLIVGDPLDKNTDIGAINSEAQLARIRDYLDVGREEGATVWSPDTPLPGRGCFLAPTLLTDVAQSSRVVQEEIFGPVLTVQTFRTYAEARDKANNTPYGLSGGVWSDKGSRVFRMGSDLRAGVVWANTFNKFDPTAPFGGYKESGIGREGGLHGLAPYLVDEQDAGWS